MDHLTDDNYKIIAAKYYDNPYCFNEAEFESDLALISTIKRTISWYNNGNDINIKRLLNNVIMFYNVFDRHGAVKLFEFKLDDSHYYQLNSILYYLSLPLVYNKEYDLIFHRKIAQELKRT